MKIDNLKVYELEESLITSAYPQQVENASDKATEEDLARCLTYVIENNDILCNWLRGVTVTFDLTCSCVLLLDLEKYDDLEFISGQPLMSRVNQVGVNDGCVDYVDSRVKAVFNEKIAKYNALVEKVDKDILSIDDSTTKAELKKAFSKIVYNAPMGIELIVRFKTNYKCLLDIYKQQLKNELPEWVDFCNELLNLPLFNKLVGILKEKNNG